MNTANNVPSKTPNIWELDEPLRKVCRAFIDARGYRTAPQELFVEAFDRDQAHAAVRKIISAMYPRLSDDEVELSYYNLATTHDLLRQGVSSEPAYRLFEAGTCDDLVSGWVEAPIFAVEDPAALYAAWQRAVSAFRERELNTFSTSD